MDMSRKFTTPGILLVFTFAFGFWLSWLGKPYNGWLFNIPKLTALGAVVWAGSQTYNAIKGASIQPLVIGLVCWE